MKSLNQLHCIMQYHLASLIGWYKCLATTQLVIAYDSDWLFDLHISSYFYFPSTIPTYSRKEYLFSFTGANIYLDIEVAS